MIPLAGARVLALDEAADSALARLFTSLGATVERVAPHDNGLEERMRAASFLIEQLGVEALTAAGWPRARIESLNPALVHVSVTTFGSGGPRALWRGSELVASAMGGVLGLTGTPDRAPVKEALDACWYHADMAAAAGALSAHYERGASGKGQHVDVSVQQVAFSRNVNSILVWQFDRRKLHRVGGALNYGRATVRCIWRLADGWCFHTLMTGRFGAPANQGLSDWIDVAGLDNPLRGVDWLRYNRSTLPAETRALWETAIAAFFLTRSKAEIATEGRRRGINATVVCEPHDALADTQLRQRNFWSSVDGIDLPGRFVSFTQDRASAASVPAGTGATRSAPPATMRSGPLTGVKVLDFSWALVGSISTKTLGDLGADVVKVESRGRPCLSRIDVQVAVSKAGNFDDKPWFAHLNSSKRSLALDMKKPESRELIEPLIRWADVVVENFSPGTMHKLGLDYASLRKLNPSLVMVSGSVYGQTGPLAQEWGVDGTGAALSGRTFLTGWPERDPVIPGAVPYGDVIVPYVMVAAVSAALQQRRVTGEGTHIDASMYEICVQQTHAAIEQAQRGTRPARQGNAAAGIYQQGVYPTAGDDRWIAITCHSSADWQRLRHVAGLADADDPAARDALIGAWTAAQPGAELMQRLQSAGIAAGVVQDIEDLLGANLLGADPQLATREALVSLEHPLLGSFGHVNTPVRFSRSVLAPYRPPAIGEHSHAIAATLAALSDVRVAELDALEIFQ